MRRRKYIAWQFGMVVAVKIFPLFTTTLRTPKTSNPRTMDTAISLTHRTTHGRTFMRTIVDETSRSDPPKQIDAMVSRRSFLKSAAAAAVLGTASPHTLMAETKEGMPQRALGRTGEKVSAIGLGGYHIGKQADEAESITIMLGSKTVTPIECLHYALNLPTSTVITGIDSLKILDQALEAAKTFKPMSKEAVTRLLARTAAAAATGRFELFKTGNRYDGTAHNPQWLG